MIFGKKVDADVDALQQQVEELKRQNKIMRDALEFYSDVKNWQGGHKYKDPDDATIFTEGAESSATVDKGSKAYRALEAVKS